MVSADTVYSGDNLLELQLTQATSLVFVPVESSKPPQRLSVTYTGTTPEALLDEIPLLPMLPK
ncbi:hypothetical protein C0Q70_01809 [Pomacea canaliculata]|uniref:Uncharacterized protein n=1 Tax=Pomacea canaliculata TaxID=400727 RepID=A0A2T7Q0I1_POMCA|nr:hypothetical protein C0Q70_01809 [Pomacea canaliculata]